MNDTVTQQLPIHIPGEIKEYLLGVLSQANIIPATEIMKQQMLEGLFIELDKYMTAKIIENMPMEHLEAFLDLQKQRKPEATESFILQHIPNAQDMYVAGFNEFRTMYVENVAKTRAARG